MKKLFLIYSLLSLCVLHTPINIYADETSFFPEEPSFPSTDQETNDQLLNQDQYNDETSENINVDESEEDSGSNAVVDEDDPLGDLAFDFDALEKKLNGEDETDEVDDGFTDEEKKEYDEKLTKKFKLSSNAKKVIFNGLYAAGMLTRTEDNSTIDQEHFEMSDLMLVVEPHIEHYVWNVWYRETKNEEIDTSENEGRGNYTGFSKEKAAAWNEHQHEIKSINAGAYPEVKDYNYSPGYTLNNKLDFWADKPGYYDVYGDPVYTQIDITAYVDVTYNETYTDMKVAQELLDKKAQQESGYNSGGGPSGGIGDAADTNLPKQHRVLGVGVPGIERSADCVLLTNPTANGSAKLACSDDERKQYEAQGFFKSTTQLSKKENYDYLMGEYLNERNYLEKKTAKKKKELADESEAAVVNKTIYKMTDNDVNKLASEHATETAKSLDKKISGYEKQLDSMLNDENSKYSALDPHDIEMITGDQSIDEVTQQSKETMEEAQSHVDQEQLEEARNASPEAAEVFDQTQGDYDESQNKQNDDGISEEILEQAKVVKKQGDKYPIAAITLRNITGSQLERIGSIGITSQPDYMFYLDSDEFWEDDPYYYYTTGDYLNFEDNRSDTYTALPFGFAQDADDLDVKMKFTDKTIHEKALVHAYNKLQDALTGEDIVIDPSLDINNKDSEYVGKVPLVNFKINDETTSQKEQKGTKKNVFLTSESEKDAEDEKKKKREEEENKESYIAQ